jgi:hypothetical protein
MTETPHRNLLMFAELTGPQSAKNVVLVTTMWDTLKPEFGDPSEREKSLKEEYWNVMIDHGAAVERFLNTSDSAWNIIDNVINRNKHAQKIPLTFQEESIDQKKGLKETGAGRALHLGLPLLIQRQNETVQPPVGCSHGSVTQYAQDSK